MKRKWSLLVNIGLVCLCLAAVAVGVYSAKNASLSVKGTIGFAANDCEVKIVASMSGGSRSSETFTEATDTTTINLGGEESGTKSWAVGKVYFDDYVNTTPYKPVADIVFTFTITNNSNFYIDANINQDFLGNESVYVYAPNLGETLAPKASCTFTVKLQLQRDETTGEFPPTLDLSFSDASPIITFNKCDAPAYLANNWKNVIIDSFGISNIKTTTKISFVRTITSGALKDFVKDNSVTKSALISAASLSGTAVTSESALGTTASPIYAYYNATEGAEEIVIYSPARIYAASCYQLFYKWNCLKSCVLDNFDSSNITDMSYMFAGDSDDSFSGGVCLIPLESLDLSRLDTSKVTNMYGMFKGCHLLTELNLKNFNTDSLTVMFGMFWRCYKLESINIDNFNTSKITSMNELFVHCYALKSIDISSFDMSNVVNTGYMFWGNKLLETIYANVSLDKNKITTQTAMFTNCSKLIGGNGTVYSASNIDATYARVDGEFGLPGYFTKR